MRFLRRYTPNMLQLVSNAPATGSKFWSLELWKSFRPRATWERFGSLDIVTGRHFVIGFGTLLSLRYYEDFVGRHLVLWVGHRGLAAFRQRSGI